MEHPISQSPSRYQFEHSSLNARSSEWASTAQYRNNYQQQQQPQQPQQYYPPAHCPPQSSQYSPQNTLMDNSTSHRMHNLPDSNAPPARKSASDGNHNPNYSPQAPDSNLSSNETFGPPANPALAVDTFSGIVVGKYKLGVLLGEGAFSKVYHALNTQNGEHMAIKVLQAADMTPSLLDLLNSEIEIMKELSHPNLLRVHEVLQSHSAVFIVMELADGGELFEYLRKRWKNGMPEEKACHYFKQIVAGLECMAQHSIVHRDLKLENLLLCDNGVVKISDFGLSCRLSDAQKDTHVVCGSYHYLAPEVLGKKHYHLGSDIWALGVILYAMMTAKMPFNHTNKDELVARIKMGRYAEIPDSVSPECQDLIAHILTLHISRRYTLEDIKSHPWYQGAKLSDDRPSSPATKSRSFTQRLAGWMGISSSEIQGGARSSGGADTGLLPPTGMTSASSTGPPAIQPGGPATVYAQPVGAGKCVRPGCPNSSKNTRLSMKGYCAFHACPSCSGEKSSNDRLCASCGARNRFPPTQPFVPRPSSFHGAGGTPALVRGEPYQQPHSTSASSRNVNASRRSSSHSRGPSSSEGPYSIAAAIASAGVPPPPQPSSSSHSASGSDSLSPSRRAATTTGARYQNSSDQS